MRSFLFLLLGVVVGFSDLSAAPLTPTEAGKHIGEEVEFQGLVYGVSFMGTDPNYKVYLNFDDYYPRQSFTVEYKTTDVPGCEKYPQLTQRNVLVKGLIESGVHGPRLILREVSQLQVLPVDEEAVLKGSVDTSMDRKLYAVAWGQILARGDYQRIEQEATRMRQQQPRFIDGLWAVTDFFEGLSHPLEDSKAGWEAVISSLTKWRADFPDSTTARTALALAYDDFGDGMEDSKEKIEPMVLWKCKQEVQPLLDSIPKGDRMPSVYACLVGQVKGEGAKEKVDALVSECRSRWPEYWGVYFAAAAKIQEVGEEGDWEAWLDGITKNDTPLNRELYARVVWSHCGRHNIYAKVFQENKVSWPRTKAGFEEMRRRYPKSWWNLNNYAQLAAFADDKETAYEIFQDFGSHVTLDLWLSWTNYQHYMDWVNSPDKTTTPTLGK